MVQRLLWLVLGVLLGGAIVGVSQKKTLAWTKLSSRGPAASHASPPDGINSLLPLQATCGSGWQERYKRLHAGILAGALPPRYLAYYCGSGLADCLRTSAGMLYAALLSRRALQIHLPRGVRLEWAFSQPSINWTLSYNHEQLIGPGLPHNRSLYIRKEADWSQRFGSADLLAEFGDSMEVIYLSSCKSTHHLLASNLHHASQLYGMGLTQDTLYACATAFLFALQPAVLDMFQQEVEVLMQPGPLKIGIQIRTGDWSFHPERDTWTVQQVQHFFDCAEEASRTRATPGQEVVWYLISDSRSLREDAGRVYGEKKTLLTNTRVRLGHIQKTGFEDAAGALPPVQVLRNQREQIMAAAGEMWLFGLADVHICSRGQGSGFGKWGAARARRWDSRYVVDVNISAGDPRPKCGYHDADGHPMK